jgi:hypothetical protein
MSDGWAEVDMPSDRFRCGSADRVEWQPRQNSSPASRNIGVLLTPWLEWHGVHRLTIFAGS